MMRGWRDRALPQGGHQMALLQGGDALFPAMVTAIDHAKRRVTLETLASVGKTVVLKGEALVLAPSRKFD